MKSTLNWNGFWTMFIIIMIVFVMTIGFAKREAHKRIESYDNQRTVTEVIYNE